MLLWALSGALHPVLSRYQPQPAVRTPPAVGVVPADALPLAELLARHGIERVRRVRLVRYRDQLLQQVVIDDGAARYFALDSGAELADGDRRYAEFLARHYLADPATQVGAIARLTAFTDEYVFVNRLLPVYRVEFARDDRLRAYVDTQSSQLATLIDERKAWMNALFLRWHNWRVFGGADAWRVPLATLVVAAAALTPLLGCALYMLAPSGAARGARRAHRVLGAVVGVTLLLSAASGACHLLHGAAARRAQPPGPVRAWPALPATALSGLALPSGAFDEVGLAIIDGRPCWRVRTAAKPHLHAAPHAGNGHAGHDGDGVLPAAEVAYLAPGPRRAVASAEPAVDEPRHARALAAAFSGLADAQVAGVTPIVTFGGEYGFVNKLLPVYRVRYATPRHDRFFVHLESATLAAHVDDLDYLEGWTFANLHKWQWLEAIVGRGARDLLQVVFALLTATLAALGLRLFLR